MDLIYQKPSAELIPLLSPADLQSDDELLDGEMGVESSIF